MTTKQPIERSLSLYEIESDLTEAMGEWLVAETALEQEGSEAGTSEAEVLRQVVVSYLQAAATKRDSIARFIKHLGIQEEATAAEIRRLQARKKAFEAAQRRLKDYIRFVAEEQGVKKLEGEHYTLRVQGYQDTVEIVNEDAVPRKYCKLVYVPSKTEIKAAYKAYMAERGKWIAEHPDDPPPTWIEIPGCKYHTNNKTVVVA